MVVAFDLFPGLIKREKLFVLSRIQYLAKRHHNILCCPFSHYLIWSIILKPFTPKHNGHSVTASGPYKFNKVYTLSRPLWRTLLASVYYIKRRLHWNYQSEHTIYASRFGITQSHRLPYAILHKHQVYYMYSLLRDADTLYKNYTQYGPIAWAPTIVLFVICIETRKWMQL